MKFNRRRFIQATGAGLSASALGFPALVRAQSGPIRLGLMTVKTGPLASGGIDMERALVQYLKEHNNTMAGRKVELFVGDSGGVPAQSRTKLQELVERDKIQIMIGPLDTASALASDDYIRQQQLLTLSVAAAEDMTQRKPNPWFTRGTSTSSQCAHAARRLLRQDAQVQAHGRPSPTTSPTGTRCAPASSACSRTAAARSCRSCFSPLTVPDYGTYIAQLKTERGRHLPRFRGLERLPLLQAVQRVRAARQDRGRRRHDRVRRGGAAQHGRRGARASSPACWYSAEIENAINKHFAANFRVDWGYDPGFYAAATYTEAAVLDATLQKINGKIEDKAGVHEGGAQRSRSTPRAGRCNSTPTATSSATSTSARSSARTGAW